MFSNRDIHHVTYKDSVYFLARSCSKLLEILKKYRMKKETKTSMYYIILLLVVHYIIKYRNKMGPRNVRHDLK